MNIEELFNEIVVEVSYRCKDGKPNWKNPEHISILSELLSESALLIPIKDDLIQLLSEAKNPKDDDYEHVGGSAYVRKSDYDETKQTGKEGAKHYKKDPKTGNYHPMSDDEYQDEKEKQGEEGGENSNPGNQEKTPNDSGDQSDGADEAEPETGTSLKDQETQDRFEEEEDAAAGRPNKSQLVTQTGELYSIGGGYYAVKPDGPAAFKSVSESREFVTEAGKNKKGMTMKTKTGKSVRVVPMETPESLTKAEQDATDDDIADSQLHMTKKQAKLQAKETGTKNVGMGTAESRAGEAMVHKGIRELKAGTSLEDLQQSFIDLVNSPDHILNSKHGKVWVDSTLATLHRVDSEIGIDNVETISWDTDYGRTSIGVSTTLKTSSDIFVKTTDGKNIGLSLKKDGVVFLNNGGWAKQSDIILDSFKDDNMPEIEFDKLKKAMSIKTFDEDLTERYKSTTKTVTDEMLTKSFKRLMRSPASVKRKVIGAIGNNIFTEIMSNPKRLLRKIDVNPEDLSSNEKKAYAKILKTYHPDEYNHLRDADNALTKRTFDAIKSSTAAQEGMKQYIVKAMHIKETVGLNEAIKEGGVDSFMTVYGIPPSGAVLNESTLVTLLGKEFKDTLAEVRAETKHTDDLLNLISKSIQIDFESGEILFKHESNNIYPLFKMTGRSRSIGAAPTMELMQTPFMAHALKEGTFDIREWNDKSLKKFKKDIIDTDKKDD